MKLFFLVFLFGVSCGLPQRNLAIQLDETPLYSEQQWALINMPYIRVSQIHRLEPNTEKDVLLGMLHFGSIVEVLRVVQTGQSSQSAKAPLWAYIQQQSIGNREIRGWVPYRFLYPVGSLTEARLISHRMQKERAATDSLDD